MLLEDYELVSTVLFESNSIAERDLTTSSSQAMPNQQTNTFSKSPVEETWSRGRGAK